MLQQRLWFSYRLGDSSAAYHIPLVLRLRGQLHQPVLQAALDALLERHEVLRTVFAQSDGVPVQEIAPSARFSLKIDVLDGHADESDLIERVHQELITPFDLRIGPLIRGRLLRVAQEEHLLVITMHQFASDGWSVGVLIRELAVVYSAIRDGHPAALPPLRIQYADCVLWQREWLAGPHLRKQLGYWQEHLRGASELLELPTDRPRPATQSYRGANARVTIEPTLASEVKELARRVNLTLPMILHAAWAIVLARLSGQNDVVIGIPVSNRRRTELEGLIGFFVNTLAVRVRLDNDPSGIDLLQNVKEVLVAAYEHQEVPFEQVVEALQPVRSLSHTAIFQVMFAFQNASRAASQLHGLTLTEEEVPLPAADFDLTLSLNEAADGITGSIEYSTDLFEAATIERWIACFEMALGQLVRDPHAKVSRMPLMNAQVRVRDSSSMNLQTIFTSYVYGLYTYRDESFSLAVAQVPSGDVWSQVQLASSRCACEFRRFFGRYPH